VIIMAETELPDSEVAQRMTAIADRYRDSAALLGERDIVIATVPGSGSSLLATLIMELGFQHLDQYFNILHEDGSVDTDERFGALRARMSGYAALDSDTGQQFDEQARFFRCHIPPDGFDIGALHGVVLLVRDPRDAAYSLYQFLGKLAVRMGVARPTTFPEFLAGSGIDGRSPTRMWTDVYESWLAVRHQVRRFAVVHFADLKTRPVPAVLDLLSSMALTVADETIARAVQRSSFESMRKHEDKVAPGLPDSAGPELRMMRRGKVNEWQEWLTPELAPHFAGADMIAAAGELGYELTGVNG
jgi:Sulfotransferase domain